MPVKAQTIDTTVTEVSDTIAQSIVKTIRDENATTNSILLSILEVVQGLQSGGAIANSSASSEGGLGQSKGRTYIYANRQYPDALWYTWDQDAKRHSPVEQDTLTGVVTGIELVSGEYRDSETKKLRVSVSGGGSEYVVTTGWGTLFCNGLLKGLSLATIAQPVAIKVVAGNTEKALFCNVAQGGKAMMTGRDDEYDFDTLLTQIQESLLAF